MFKEVDSLLNRNTTTLPAHESPQELCDAFAKLFSEKVEKIYNTLEEEMFHVDAEGLTAVDSQVSVPNPLTKFNLLSEEDITKDIKRLSLACWTPYLRGLSNSMLKCLLLL